MKNSTTISIDLAKNVQQVGVFNRYNKLKSNTRMNSRQMAKTVAQHPEAVIYMEACGSAHYWGRRFEAQGHQVKLVPAHVAARYRNGNKNDSNDVIGIFEAANRPDTYFVSVRPLEQQDLATELKYRRGLVKQRTQLANRLHGFGLEYGVKFPKGINALRRKVPEALEDASNELTMVARRILRSILDSVLLLDQQIKQATLDLVTHTKQLQPCREIEKMPGIGWIVAAGLYARIGNGSAYRRGRDASSSIGVVPGHSGSGGKNKIGGISKRGDRYLRSLVIHGARAAVTNIRDKQDGLSCWIRKQLATHHINQTTVALANKLIRMAWAILSSGGQYRVPVAQ